MALLIPKQTLTKIETTLTAANAEFGAQITASATPHTKGSPTQLIAATAYDTFGIIIVISDTAVTSANTRTLVDIMTGAGGSEVTLIPNLLASQIGASAAASAGSCAYFFPLYIPAGTRISARSQALAASDTAYVAITLLQHQIPGKWYGQRVTAYGPNTSTSTGVAHTPGTGGAYAATTQIDAAIANRIRAMQIGVDLATDTSGSTVRLLARIAAAGSTNYVAEGLPLRESSTIESMDFNIANMVLSQMGFDIPAGSYLGVGAQTSGTAEARGFAIYGVD
jgi:hypothetical protein